MSKAAVFKEYGSAEVVRVIDVAEPRPGSGEVRLRVQAAGVQPFDNLFHSGAAADWAPARFPQGLGNEAAGIIDAVGEGVDDLVVGSEVLGWTDAGALAEYVVVAADHLISKPPGMQWEHAGSLSASGQTAHTAMERLRVKSGETVLVHAAAGGVGTMAVQLAVAVGATVIGTAGPHNHEYLRLLGATPVAYGDGLVDRVRELAPDGVDAALDAVGAEESLRASVELTKDLDRVGAIAGGPLVEQLRAPRLSTDRSRRRLAELLDLYRQDKLRVWVHRTFPLAQVADALREVATGHVRGKVVVMP